MITCYKSFSFLGAPNNAFNCMWFYRGRFARSIQRWCDFNANVHVHQNSPIKRAGEAGIALRARRDDRIYFAHLCASWRRAVGGQCDAVVIASRVLRLTRFEDVPPGGGILGGV